MERKVLASLLASLILDARSRDLPARSFLLFVILLPVRSKAGQLIIDRGWIEDGIGKEKGEGEGAWIRYYNPEGGGFTKRLCFQFSRIKVNLFTKFILQILRSRTKRAGI